MKYYMIASLLCAAAIAAGQTIEPLPYPMFIQKVAEGNRAYAAEKLNVAVADAELTAAKVFNDPSLAVEYADNDDRHLQMGRSLSVELSKTFSVGKRSANIRLAQSQKALDAALLEDYFRSLCAEATLAYLEALKQDALYQVKEDACRNIRRLAEGDSVKFALGKITEVDAMQSRLEAEIAYNELLQAKTELYNVYAGLNLWTGGFSHTTLFRPVGTLQAEPREFDAALLLQTALENRADLQAALKNVDVARKALKVAKRERNMDFDVALGYNYNTEVRNEIAPAPTFNGVTLGISVPLKFSGFNRGTVRAAEARQRQAEINYEQAELEVQNSVMQSLRQYLSLQEQVRRYDNGLLQDAKAVIDGKIYSYDRGETSLLEVLDAQRTHNELRTAYIETLFNCFAALVALERNAGIWDIHIH
ncbi:MAG: TolC family protein [Bacteroidales bacterium]